MILRRGVSWGDSEKQWSLELTWHRKADCSKGGIRPTETGRQCIRWTVGGPGQTPVAHQTARSFVLTQPNRVAHTPPCSSGTSIVAYFHDFGLSWVLPHSFIMMPYTSSQSSVSELATSTTLSLSVPQTVYKSPQIRNPPVKPSTLHASTSQPLCCRDMDTADMLAVYSFPHSRRRKALIFTVNLISF